MKLFKYILLCFSITSYLICEEVEITVISDSFIIDTVAPEIELYSPSHGDVFQAGETVIVTWDASDASSGMYFVKAEAGGSVTTQKLVLMK